MKTKVLLALAVIGLTTVSCRKERTCSCTDNMTTVDTDNNGSTTTVSATSYKIEKEKQYKNTFREENNCYSQQYTEVNDVLGGQEQVTHNITCDLK